MRSLTEAMHADALTQPYVCTDATGVLVQYPGRCKSGHFWVRVAPRRHVLFQSSMRHDAAAVDRLLPGYTGYVVADAHNVYDHIYGADKASEAGCWSHMRKYVLEALMIDPEPACEAMACIEALFMIERGIERAPPEERRRVRNAKSKPIIEKLLRVEVCEAHKIRNRSVAGILKIGESNTHSECLVEQRHSRWM